MDPIVRPASEKPSNRLTRAIFIRLIAAIYLLAFLSAAAQMKGLYGEHGILPIRSYLAHEGNLFVFITNPTIFWFNSSDEFLVLVPLIGAVAAALAMLGVLCGPTLFICWFLYLSIITVGQEFMSFQWDILLLETGFLAMYFSTWRPLDYFWSTAKKNGMESGDGGSSNRRRPYISSGEPSVVLLWLNRWLLFRLMLESGLVKLRSGDVTWRDLSALYYHFETQPLPTPIGWFFQQLPHFIMILGTILVFSIELFVPFMIFGNRKIRAWAALLLVFLQLLILLTGNYCFFNLLTIALCLPLIDDKLIVDGLTKISRGRLKHSLESLSVTCVPKARTLVYWMRQAAMFPAVILIVLVSSVRTSGSLTGFVGFPEPVVAITALASPWHIASTYGLFAVMTTTRPEISVEGSMDGVEWKEYVFKYKPGPLNRTPPIVAPHQPRLDWQMWFASLGTVFDNQWFLAFVQRLFENSPDVTALLETNPFEKEPPVYIRAQVYQYHMTDIPTLLKTGNWWKKEYDCPYLPAIKREAIQ